MIEGIDLVVPYVDSSDPNWQKLFNEYNPIKDQEIEGINARNRFRGQGDFFKYWFRCVQINLPWIRKIHLVVQSDSQVPKWINRNEVHIVYHSDIIPEEYLPTFNSTCIEMFLWKIEDLSEKFLYANDDFYVLKHFDPSAFFLKDKVRLNTNAMRIGGGMYNNHCINGYCLVYGQNKDKYVKTHPTVPSFFHKIRPYLRSKMEECFKKYENEIMDSLSQFREKKNFNIYLFGYYLIRNNFQMADGVGSHRCLSSKTSDRDIGIILNSCNTVALQDDNFEINLYEKYSLNNWFRNKYNFKSKYEI